MLRGSYIWSIGLNNIVWKLLLLLWRVPRQQTWKPQEGRRKGEEASFPHHHTPHKTAHNNKTTTTTTARSVFGCEKWITSRRLFSLQSRTKLKCENRLKPENRKFNLKLTFCSQQMTGQGRRCGTDARSAGRWLAWPSTRGVGPGYDECIVATKKILKHKRY